MKRNQTIKVGFVSVKRSGDRWIGRWRDPVTQADCKRVCPAGTTEEIRDWALGVNRLICAQRAIPGMRADKPVLTVRDALVQSATEGGGSEGHRKNTAYAINRFLAFLEEHHPLVRAWADVTPAVYASYVRHLRDKSLAYDTARLYLLPVRVASRFWSIEEQEHYRDIAKLTRVKLQRGQRRPVRILEPDQMREFLLWLREHSRQAYTMAVLMGCCGLRELEAAYLRWCDVDWTQGTLRVACSEAHRPKNVPSRRTIPVTDEVLVVLREHMETLNPKDTSPDAYLFLNARGRPWKQAGLFNMWKHVMRAARQALPWTADFSPKCLRKCFSTFARRGGVATWAMDAYFGHAPTSVREESYDAVTLEDLKAVVGCFEKGFGRMEADRNSETASAAKSALNA